MYLSSSIHIQGNKKKKKLNNVKNILAAFSLQFSVLYNTVVIFLCNGGYQVEFLSFKRKGLCMGGSTGMLKYMSYDTDSTKMLLTFLNHPVIYVLWHIQQGYRNI